MTRKWFQKFQKLCIALLSNVDWHPTRKNKEYQSLRVLNIDSSQKFNKDKNAYLRTEYKTTHAVYTPIAMVKIDRPHNANGCVRLHM